MMGMATEPLSYPLHRYAQTNLQLYAQLRAGGYATSDVEAIGHAYRIACRLFTGRFRGSGKTFLAHLIGTASIVVGEGAPVPVIAAGLLHAAYQQGDFGCAWRRCRGRRRDELVGVIGAQAEELVVAYTAMAWNGRSVAQLAGHSGALTAKERHVLLLRLANELEDQLDLSPHYCGNSLRRAARLIEIGEACVGLARELGYGQLAEELSRAISACQSHQVPDALRSDSASSFTLIPGSARPRMALQFRCYAGRARKWFNGQRGQPRG